MKWEQYPFRELKAPYQDGWTYFTNFMVPCPDNKKNNMAKKLRRYALQAEKELACKFRIDNNATYPGVRVWRID